MIAITAIVAGLFLANSAFALPPQEQIRVKVNKYTSLIDIGIWKDMRSLVTHRALRHLTGSTVASGWVFVEDFTSNTCSQTYLAGTMSEAIGICVPYKTGSYMYTVDTTTVQTNITIEFNNYTDTSCTVLHNVKISNSYVLNSCSASKIVTYTKGASNPAFLFSNAIYFGYYLNSMCSELVRQEVQNPNYCNVYNTSSTPYHGETVSCSAVTKYADTKCTIPVTIAPTHAPTIRPTPVSLYPTYAPITRFPTLNTTPRPSYAPYSKYPSYAPYAPYAPNVECYLASEFTKDPRLSSLYISYGCSSSSSSNGNKGSDLSCFFGFESVQLQSGAVKLLVEVSVGDMILVADVKGENKEYSPVVAVPHSVNNLAKHFVVLTTETGRDIRLTPDHLIVAGVCESLLGLVRTSSLQADACIQTVTGQERIAKVSTVEGRGVYSVVTLSADKFLVVNGIVASPFAINHAVTNAFYGLHRLIYSLTPSGASNHLQFWSRVLFHVGNIAQSFGVAI